MMVLVLRMTNVAFVEEEVLPMVLVIVLETFSMSVEFVVAAESLTETVIVMETFLMSVEFVVEAESLTEIVIVLETFLMNVAYVEEAILLVVVVWIHQLVTTMPQLSLMMVHV
jgi:hypothetical protein